MFNTLRLKSIYLLLFFHVLSVVLFLPSALIDINWLFIPPHTTFVDWLAMSLVLLVTKYKLIFIVQVYSTCWRFMVHTGGEIEASLIEMWKMGGESDFRGSGNVRISRIRSLRCLWDIQIKTFSRQLDLRSVVRKVVWTRI